MQRVLAFALLFGASHLAQAQVPVRPEGPRYEAPPAALAIGQRLYRDGIRPSDEPLAALGAAQTRLSGRDVACMACHRRSGFGTSEGRFTIRPITGPALLQEQFVPVRSPRVKARLGTSERPPYNEALLMRAIRTGLDSTGKQLDPIMPRYALSDEELRALAAYLLTLSAQPSPGVDDADIHFATVIQPGVAPERRRAMLDVMNAFVKDKNSNVRSQEKRREAGNMRMDRAYRKWVLDLWELAGPSESWPAQLDDFYRRQPVFAIISGLGDASWRPIHEFSERREIPTVFPHAILPVVDGANNYTFYFSRGVTLEADVLAKFLREQSTSEVVQVYRLQEPAATAAAALRAALATSPGPRLKDVVLDGLPDVDFWQRAGATSSATLVLWLSADDLAALPKRSVEAPAVYLSSSLLGGKRAEAGPRASGDVRLVYPSDLAPKHDARLLRDKLWFHNKNIAITDEVTQVNTLFALTIVNDSLGHIADSFSRDYFVERIEHAANQMTMQSDFAQISLGPGQRFAAKGSTIVRPGDPGGPAAKSLSGWLVP